MFNLEFRLVPIFGLVGALLVWTLIYCITRVVQNTLYNTHDEAGFLTKKTHENFKKIKNISRQILYSGYVLTILVWLIVMVFSGWKATNTYDEPQGVLEPQGVMSFETTDNAPDTANVQIRKEGEELQTEGREKLDAWRQDFLNKNKKESDK